MAKLLPLLLPLMLMVYILSIYIPVYCERGWKGYDIQLVSAFLMAVVMFGMMLRW